MNKFNRIEIFNSYLFLRKILGLTNKKKDDTFLVGICHNDNQIFALNENSNKVILLLELNATTKLWFFKGGYLELEPIADHIRKAIQSTRNPLLDELALEALQQIVNYQT